MDNLKAIRRVVTGMGKAALPLMSPLLGPTGGPASAIASAVLGAVAKIFSESFMGDANPSSYYSQNMRRRAPQSVLYWPRYPLNQ